MGKSLILLLIGAVIISGCIGQESTSTPTTTTTAPTTTSTTTTTTVPATTTTIEPTTTTLQEPGNYLIEVSGEIGVGTESV